MKKLSGGQIAVLILTTVPMIAVGIAGAIGTYANATSVLHRKETALGVVAAGEGATLVAGLVMIVVTMLGQTAPTTIRAALWLLPAAASVMGLALAPTAAEAVVFALTPLAMTASAEGISLLARRIVVHRTGVDVEAQRRNATILRRIAYHRARAERHPWKKVRKLSELLAWRLMAKLGHSDATLGSALTDVQNTRIVDGANIALAAMLSSATDLPAATARPAVAASPATAKPARHTVTAKTATPPDAEAIATPETATEQTVPVYEPGTPQYVVRELWLRLNHQPGQSAIVDALGAAGLANSEQQARKIRSQVRRDNPGLPGPRAA
ncbi:hypothetical protein ACGFNY_05005 [Streptomyces chartreusis]|uniref:hypothetical protein n=1 Tax=Streptomyces chartreusis TaxID=1969 RepID=UPI003720E98E